jgi:hypothetical protein
MKIYGERTVPEHVTTELRAIRCELCGKEAANGDWSAKTYDVAVVTVSMEVGEDFGGSGSIKRTSYELCLDCFRNRLMDWIEGQGAHRTVEELSW